MAQVIAAAFTLFVNLGTVNGFATYPLPHYGSGRVPFAKHPRPVLALRQHGAPRAFTPASAEAVAATVSADTLYQGMSNAMSYIPSKQVVVCGCAKCGSTSLLKFIYSAIFKHPWEFRGAPYLHEVWSPRWENTFRVITSPQEQKDIMDDQRTFSFALVREPKGRILSAWSSKVACDRGDRRLSADAADRAVLVPKLLALQGRGNTATCLELHDFLLVLRDIHMANKTHLLNDHFRPQTEECFAKFPPDKWSKVVEIGAPGSFVELASKLGAGVKVAPHTHGSSHGFYKMSPEDKALLSEITAVEVRALTPFLSKKTA